MSRQIEGSLCENEQLRERVKELEVMLSRIRDLLTVQEDKDCLGTNYPTNAYECAPWPVVDEVIDSITKSLNVVN